MVFQTVNGFDRKSEPGLVALSDNINSMMAAATYFTSLQTRMTANIDFTNKMRSSMIAAATGDKEAIAIKGVNRLALIDSLRQMGVGIDSIAQGNIVILKASGYPLTRVKTASPNLTEPPPPKVSTGLNPGELIATGKKQTGISTILFLISKDPASGIWEPHQSRTNSITFSNLISGTRYYVKYELSGPRKQKVTSSTVSYIAQ